MARPSLSLPGPAAAMGSSRSAGAAVGSSPRLVLPSWLARPQHIGLTAGVGSTGSARRGSSARIVAHVQADFVLVPWDASRETWWVL